MLIFYLNRHFGYMAKATPIKDAVDKITCPALKRAGVTAFNN